MREHTKFYINGKWVDPVTPKTLEVLDPSTEEACATISLGSEADVDLAVAAAKAAFDSFSQTSVEERVEMLERLAAIFQRRIGEIAEAIRLEMGAPIKLASTAQAYAGLGHITEAAKVLKTYAFTEDLGPHRVVREPIGVCGLITPWNWPLNQVSLQGGARHWR
jgi:aldehyde dehydrogenase (NAD+)